MPVADQRAVHLARVASAEHAREFVQLVAGVAQTQPRRKHRLEGAQHAIPRFGGENGERAGEPAEQQARLARRPTRYALAPEVPIVAREQLIAAVA